MHVWGKIIGAFFGFLLGGIFGMLLGIFLGHKFDTARSSFYRGSGFAGFGSRFSSNEARQAEFFHAAFAVMGHLAKAKGRVTQEEIRVASAIMDRMNLHGESRHQAQQAFREGKESDFPLHDILQAVRRSSGGRTDLMQFFLELQIQAAFADGQLDPTERQVLHTIARELGFSAQQLEQRLHMQEAAFRFQQGGFHQQYQQYQQQQAGGWQQAPSRDQVADAYELLGVEAGATQQQVKRAYRKLMNEHHPDKLVAKGLPPEMMEVAKQKAQEIQAAYDLILKQNGFKKGA